MAKVTLENISKNDWLFPVMDVRTKEVQKHTIVEGGLVEVQTEEEVRYRKDNVHLPPTLDAKNPGTVEVDEEVYEALAETEIFQALVEAREIRVNE